GAEVSIYYDPMISKLAAWGRTRAEAIDRMRRSLDEYEVTGIKTTLPFFREVVRDAEFIEGRLDTGFIERFFARRDAARATLAVDKGSTESKLRERDVAVIAAALAYAQKTQAAATRRTRDDEPPSRWKLSGRVASR
ncbi:MAG TPA: hypothetical protein VFX96_01435, partial [Pyrinomonadaceae bacterium]|nr:hypothetical protein [Pyrinomonadaceae bacterium]